MKIIQITIGIVVFIGLMCNIYYLVKTEKNDKKLKEMIILNSILFFFSGRDIIMNLEKYNMHRFLVLISWILFFYMIYFLIYYDYKKVISDDDNLKEMTKKEIFQLFRQRASENNKIFLKNRPFIISFVSYLILRFILVFFK